MRQRLAISAATARATMTASAAAIVLALSAAAPRAQTAGNPSASQQSASPLPTTFAAASIKVNRSGDFRRAMGPAPGGRFSATNVPLRDLIAFAYGVSNSRATLQIVGGPSWIDTERFDVDAVVGDDTVPRTQMVPMLRALLAERFKLKAHTETRDMPIYQLVTARGDGRLGPGLRRSAIDCDARRAARARGTPPAAPPPPGPPVDPRTIRPTCALRQSPGQFAGDAASLVQLAEGLAPFAGRIIVDHTGQAGYFDVDLAWTPDRPAPAADAQAATVDRDAGPELFTAIREQLGLTLERARGPVDVVVVDALERLDPN